MSACELLENAVRYATAGSEIGLEVRDTRAGFEIRVTNEAVDSRVALLRRRVQELAAGNTADAYRKALRRLLTDSGDASAAGGLGLLRIRHEASVEVALEVQGRRVSVIATGAGSEWSARRDSHASGEHKTVKEGHGRLRGG